MKRYRKSHRFHHLGMLLICIAWVLQLARLFSAPGRIESAPFHSANDRSRWCTVASLVEAGTYQIDQWIALKDADGKRPWATIDMVRHRGWDGKDHAYSSKPPLLATLIAGAYWPLRQITGISLTDHPHYMARLILLLVQLIPLGLFWSTTWKWMQEQVRSSWGLAIGLAFLLWGTFLSTFSISLNNHLPGAIAVGGSLILLERSMRPGQSPIALWQAALLGALTAFGSTCDLPALSWWAITAALLTWHFGGKTLAAYLVGGIPILATFLATTWLAHGDLRPPYAHRGLGDRIGTVEGLPLQSGLNKPHPAQEELNATTQQSETGDLSGIHPASTLKPPLDPLVQWLQQQGFQISDRASLRRAERLGHWELHDSPSGQRFAVVQQGDRWDLHQWDDWYDYPGSYWLPENKRGVDRGEASHLLYCWHTLLGHHGIFSLTPFWWLAIPGLWMAIRDRSSGPSRLLFVAIALVTLVCLTFYWTRPVVDRNYGGVSSGFRWAFWMIPLWMLPTWKSLEAMSKSFRLRSIITASLLLSIFSASFPWINPWVHPWIYQWWSYLGWIPQ
jgi:hypothetical protein